MQPEASSTPPWVDLTLISRDGLRLYGRRYGARGGPRKPMLCLAGLTRNGRDFHDLAMALSQGDKGRAVYTLDTRGRGLSDRDPDWKNYVVPIEMLDVMDAVAAWQLSGAIFFGTSRGGLVTMVLGAAQPTVIGAVVLNDIGPVIEREGLMRISTYVGRTPVPVSWDEATETVATMNAKTFPDVPRSQWAEVARAWFNEADGQPAAGYDLAIAKTFSVSDGPAPQLWPQFEALAHVPLMIIRGGNSDLLSKATQEQMQARHPNSTGLVVPGQGHPPLLKDETTINAIRAFAESVDAKGSGAAKAG